LFLLFLLLDTISDGGIYQSDQFESIISEKFNLSIL